ncbi:hypothetical protein VSVS12_03891 [Vibrio scophthalmi]|nr:hypothetical protein VSVS12_03891 [Vibrio scophthalmi]
MIHFSLMKPNMVHRTNGNFTNCDWPELQIPISKMSSNIQAQKAKINGHLSAHYVTGFMLKAWWSVPLRQHWPQPKGSFNINCVMRN